MNPYMKRYITAEEVRRVEQLCQAALETSRGTTRVITQEVVETVEVRTTVHVRTKIVEISFED